MTRDSLGNGWSGHPGTKGSRFFGLITILSTFLLVGCHQQGASNAAVLMSYEITPQPARIGIEHITFRLQDRSSNPITGAHLSLEGDMSHAGMAPIFGEATEHSAGTYEGQLNFTMPGDWVVLVHMTLPNRQKVERQIEVKGVETK